MVPKRVTLRDVAEEAGVSVSTVSLVVNRKTTGGKIRISDGTVRHVEHVAKNLHYVPNLSARAMSQGRTMMIGLVMYEIWDSASQLEMVSGISAGMTTEGDLDLELDEIRGMLDRGFDRLIFEASDDLLGRFQDDETVLPNPERFIFLNRPSVRGVPAVKVDEEKAAYLATRHLLDLGHREIAFMGENPTRGLSELPAMSALAARYQGFVRATGDAGVTPRSAHDENEIESLLSDGLTGVYCSRSYGAADLLAFCSDRGIGVPHDLSIVGQDDAREKRVSRPRITTVDLRAREVGEYAGRMALMSIEGRPPESHNVAPRLIVRDSAVAVDQREAA